MAVLGTAWRSVAVQQLQVLERAGLAGAFCCCAWLLCACSCVMGFWGHEREHSVLQGRRHILGAIPDHSDDLSAWLRLSLPGLESRRLWPIVEFGRFRLAWLCLQMPC